MTPPDDEHSSEDNQEVPAEAESHIWTFDIDLTVTEAPLQYARLTHALRSIGDRCVAVTGHGPEQTREELLDALGVEFDGILIVDPIEDGSGKAEALKELGSWFHFDNEVAFGPAIVEVCPVAFQYVQVPVAAESNDEVPVASSSLRDRFHGDRMIGSGLV